MPIPSSSKLVVQQSVSAMALSLISTPSSCSAPYKTEYCSALVLTQFHLAKSSVAVSPKPASRPATCRAPLGSMKDSPGKLPRQQLIVSAVQASKPTT